MTERDKIIEIVLNSDITGIKIRNITGGISTANTIADALIAANIGYVSEWKERAEKEKDEKNMWKCTANDWKQRFESRDKQYNDRIVSSCKALQLKDEKIAKYKHRAEVAEERLKKLKKTEGDLTVEEEKNILENLVEEAKHRSFVFERELVKHKIAFDKAIKLAYKLRTDLDVLSCSSCEFGYAIDTYKKIGLYDDCENRWKEELLQQAEREVEEEKK